MTSTIKADWTWIPGVRVGPFRFGEALPIQSPWKLELLPPSMEEATWQTFRVADEAARVCVEDGNVEYVECVASLVYEEREIIGMSIREVQGLLSAPLRLSKAYVDGAQTWECVELGLTLWVESGCIESVTVGLIL